MIAIIHAHPYAQRSIAGRALLDAVRELPGVAVRSLYDCYPDFSIDVRAERELLARARLVVWQHPLSWYSVPALLKLWFEVVLGRGWAFGDGADALAGKDCLWVTTTGADAHSYAPNGLHGYPLAAFAPPIERTARLCGMRWLEPIAVHAAHRLAPAELAEHAAAYRARLQPYLAPARG